MANISYVSIYFRTMSSESEDEFQSADEGSDLEDLECNPKASVHPQPPTLYAASCERVHETEEDETHIQDEEEEFKDGSNIEAAVDTNKNSEDTIERIETIKESEKAQSVDVLCTSEDETISVPVSCIKGDESVEEKPINQFKVNRCSEDSVAQDVDEKDYSCVEERQEEIIKPESNKEKYKVIPKEHDEDQHKEVIEDSKEKSGNTKCKSDKLSSQTASSDNFKTENKSDKVEVVAPSSKPKPIRQSKIGMKKPREKLGERLGVRKLGTKVDSKSVDSISSSDTVKPREEDNTMPTNERTSQVIPKSIREDRGEEDEKMKKRQQWEEQQERWHQALNLDKDKKEVSILQHIIVLEYVIERRKRKLQGNWNT